MLQERTRVSDMNPALGPRLGEKSARPPMVFTKPGSTMLRVPIKPTERRISSTGIGAEVRCRFLLC